MVRAVSGNSYSLPDTHEFNSDFHDQDEEDNTGKIMALLGAMALAAILITGLAGKGKKENDVLEGQPLGK